MSFPITSIEADKLEKVLCFCEVLLTTWIGDAGRQRIKARSNLSALGGRAGGFGCEDVQCNFLSPTVPQF